MFTDKLTGLKNRAKYEIDLENFIENFEKD
jgi:GGDEF domain-containing protein